MTFSKKYGFPVSQLSGITLTFPMNDILCLANFNASDSSYFFASSWNCFKLSWMQTKWKFHLIYGRHEQPPPKGYKDIQINAKSKTSLLSSVKILSSKHCSSENKLTESQAMNYRSWIRHDEQKLILVQIWKCKIADEPGTGLRAVLWNWITLRQLPLPLAAKCTVIKPTTPLFWIYLVEPTQQYFLCNAIRSQHS